MNKLAQRISESEREIMRVLWNAGEPITLAQIRTTLQSSTDWEDSTIKTLLHRLYKKGVVEQTKKTVYHYTPLVSENEYNEYATQLLIDKLYQGSAKNLIASLVSSKRINEQEIAELRSLLYKENEK